MYASTPLVVEVENLKAKVNSTRNSILAGLGFACVFSMLTFGMVLIALDNSKDLSVVDSVLTHRESGAQVATKPHLSDISDPFDFASDVQFISMYGPDGGMVRHKVLGYREAPCEGSILCVDGARYTFDTAKGPFAGYTQLDNNGEETVVFAPIVDGEVLVIGAHRSLLGVARRKTIDTKIGHARRKTINIKTGEPDKTEGEPDTKIGHARRSTFKTEGEPDTKIGHARRKTIKTEGEPDTKIGHSVSRRVAIKTGEPNKGEIGHARRKTIKTEGEPDTKIGYSSVASGSKVA